MARVIRRQRQRRGFFGWIFLLVFLAFNAFMVLWMGKYISLVSQMQPANHAAQIGHNIGTSMGIGAILIVWGLGSGITALLALLTRGHVVIVEDMSRR